MLSRRQRQVLDFVERFLAEQGYSPSLREIADGLGLSSVATVHEHVAALADQGALRRPAANKKRGLEPLPPSAREVRGAVRPGVAVLNLAGTIAAGAPIESLEVAEEVEIPESYVSGGECFALRVRGDSMKDEGIRDNDVVVVRSQSTADNGQTVVALVDGEATLKKFFRKNGTVELRPANETMKPIVVKAERVQVRGVVVSLLRKFS